MWPMGAAWASTHIWEHYLFTEDEEFLKEHEINEHNPREGFVKLVRIVSDIFGIN